VIFVNPESYYVEPEAHMMSSVIDDCLELMSDPITFLDTFTQVVAET